MTPVPGASDPKPTFQELVTPWASVQYFKFIRGSGAPRVPRAAARRALLLTAKTPKVEEEEEKEELVSNCQPIGLHSSAVRGGESE